MSEVKSDWLEGTKPKYIESRYSAYLTWDLEELGIDWDEVKDWDIGRLTLTIKFKNGTTKYYENFDVGEVDYKHGLEEVLVLNKEFEEVEGEN
jgi:coenzyme F420-reducing hydrogenase beta subunit